MTTIYGNHKTWNSLVIFISNHHCHPFPCFGLRLLLESIPVFPFLSCKIVIRLTTHCMEDYFETVRWPETYEMAVTSCTETFPKKWCIRMGALQIGISQRSWTILDGNKNLVDKGRHGRAFSKIQHLHDTSKASHCNISRFDGNATSWVFFYPTLMLHNSTVAGHCL